MQHQTLPDQYRVTFDVMAGIEPITFPAATTTDQVAYQVQRAFIAVDTMHPDNAQVAIDVEAGTVVVSVDGDVIEHGSITRVDEQPPAKPDYWLTLADSLRQAAVKVATLVGTTPIPAYAELTILGSYPQDSDSASAALVDQMAAAFDLTPYGTPSGSGKRDYRAETRRHGNLRVSLRTYLSEEDTEKAAMRAELETLRAQLAEGGTR